jgi:ribulose bisphosphate carboxylase small subunit
MKKIIDIDQRTLTKLKVLSVFENLSVKALMEKGISFFVEHQEKERFKNMTEEEKEDLGLLLLMQQSDPTDTVSEDEFFKSLEQ